MSNDQYGGGWNNQNGGQQPGEGQPQGGWDPYQQGASQPQGSANPPGQGWSNDPYGQNPAGQNPAGQNPAGQNPEGQGQYGQQPGTGPYSQPSAGQGWSQNPTGQPQYGQNQYGQPQYGQTPPTQNQFGQNQFGQDAPTQAQPTASYPQSAFGQGQQQYGQAPKKKSPLPWVAAAVGVALIVAVGAYALNNRDKQTQTQTPPTTVVSTPADPGSTHPPSTPASSPPESTPAQVDDSAKAPGPGTLASVMAQLTKLGFTCEDEQGQPFTSRLCTHFEKAPTMFVYIGANPDGSLGRVSLSVQSTKSPATSKALSDFLIAQFAAPADVAKVKAAIAGSSGNTYEEGSTDRFEYRGIKDGSIVMYAPDFASDGTPARIDMTDSKLRTALKAKSYACTNESSSVTICTKTSGAVKSQVRYAEDSDGIVFINVQSAGKPRSSVASALTAERANAFGPLPGDLASKVSQAVEDADPNLGGMSYVDGFLFDYYPPAAGSSGQVTGTFYIRSSCWQNYNRHC